jgi:hypothetical protein
LPERIDDFAAYESNLYDYLTREAVLPNLPIFYSTWIG